MAVKGASMTVSDEGWQRQHGGVNVQEADRHGWCADDILDFSINSNPYGPCPAVVAAVRAAAFDRYPDNTAEPLKVAMAAAYAVAKNRLAIGNGAAELMWSLAGALVTKGTRVLLAEPTFCEFRAACLHRGAQIHEWRAKVSNAFAVDVDGIDRRVAEVKPHIVYICNPNSPTGAYVRRDQLLALVRQHPDVRFLIDQAFLSLSRFADEDATDWPDHVIILRSFTKEHAIAGLRLGYLLADPDLISQVEQGRPFWTINALAQAAGIAACTAREFVTSSCQQILADYDDMVAALRSIGLRPLPSATLFTLVPVAASAVLRERLLLRGIQVRDCASYGLPNMIRLCARPKADVARLVEALQKESVL